MALPSSPRNRLLGNFFSFSAIQAMQLVIPLLALPWLGRILGEESFGLLMYMSLIPQSIGLIMEWGLTLGGARLAAQHRLYPKILGSLLAEVFSAKILLALACILGVLLLYPILPHASSWPFAYFMAASEGICRGSSPLWFFQGAGYGIKRMACLDAGSSLFALILVFLFIHSPQDWQEYFLFTACCKFVAYSWLIFHLCRQYAPGLNIPGGLKIIIQTKALFASSFFTVIYTYGTQLATGFFLPAAQMGILVACGKMLRALSRLVIPVSQVIFPEICRLCQSSPAKSRFILRISALGTFVIMCICAAIAYFLAPQLLYIALGTGYGDATKVFRILILAAPFMAANQVLGTQVMVPFRKEKAQMRAQGIIAFASIPLASLAAGLGGIFYAAAVPVCLESLLCAILIAAIARYCPQAFWKK